MATIRQHRQKWQVQIRRAGVRPMSKSFTLRKDAFEWARHIERQADRHELPTDPKALQNITFGELVRRYRDTVRPRKKTARAETYVLNAFLSHKICPRRHFVSIPLRHVRPRSDDRRRWLDCAVRDSAQRLRGGLDAEFGKVAPTG